MKLKFLSTLLLAGALLVGVTESQAGAIRYAGKKIADGTNAVVSATSDGAQAAGETVTSAGKSSGGAIKSGAVTVGKGAAATPGLAARGTKALGKGIARAIW